MPTASVDDVRGALSVALRSVPAVRSAWISSSGDTYYLWLQIDPSDMAQERQYYTLLDPLYDAFPSTRFVLRVLNPATYDELIPDRILPASAVRIGGYAP